MKKLLPALLFALLPTFAGAWTKNGTVYTTDGSSTDVQSAVDDASTDDIIDIPAGTFDWPAPALDVTKQVHVRGSGSATTTVNIKSTTSNFIQLDPATSSTVVTFSGVTISDPDNINSSNVMRCGGFGQVSVNDVVFDDPRGLMVRVTTACTGVFSHCDFYTDGSDNVFWFFNGENQKDDSDSAGNGELSWRNAMDWTGDDAIFIEDCNFYSVGTNLRGCTDYYGAAKVVIRHCYINAYCSSHGTGDGSGSDTGPRRIEFYENDWAIVDETDTTSLPHRNRGGPAIYMNNTVTGFTGAGMQMSYYRYWSPHGKHQIYPTFGTDTWTVVGGSASTTTASTTKGTLADTTANFSSGHEEYIWNVDIGGDLRYTRNLHATDLKTVSSTDTGTDEVTFTASHGWTDGTVVRFDLTSDGQITSTGNFIRDHLLLEVVVVDADTVTFTQVSGNNFGNALDVTGGASANQYFRKVAGSTIASVDTGTDTVTFEDAHGWSVNDMVYSPNGTLPAGLSGVETFFVASVPTTTTATFSAAPGGSTIDITGTDAGAPMLHVGENWPGFNKYNYLPASVNAGSTPGTTTVELTVGQQSVWQDHRWYLSGLDYELIDGAQGVGLDMPGAGRRYAAFGYTTTNEGTMSEWDNTLVNSMAVSSVDTAGNTITPDVSEFFNFADAYLLEDNCVQFTTTGTLPAPLAVGTNYWIVNPSSPTIQVASTLGGAAIDLTTTGTGTHTLTQMANQDIEGVYAWGNSWGTTAGLSGYGGVVDGIHIFDADDSSTYMDSGAGLGGRTAIGSAVLNSGYYDTSTQTLWVARDTDRVNGVGGDDIPDAWVLHWQPYTYPHPLALSAPASSGSTATSATAGSVTIGP